MQLQHAHLSVLITGLLLSLSACTVNVNFNESDTLPSVEITTSEPAEPSPTGTPQMEDSPAPPPANVVAGSSYQESQEQTRHDQGIRDAVLSPCMKYVYTASKDGTAKKWSLETGAVLCTMDGHFGDLFGMDINPEGNRIVTASRDSDARVWDTETGDLIHTLDEHSELVWDAAFSPDGNQIATVSGDRTVRLWDASTGKLMRILHPEQWSYSCAYAMEGNILATGHHSTSIVWNPETGEEINRITIGGHQNYLQATAISPDGTIVATGGLDRAVTLWDTRIGAQLHQFAGHSGYISRLDFSPNGQWLLSCGGSDQKAFLWKVATREMMFAFESEGSVESVDFSADGTRIMLAMYSAIQIYDHSTGSLVQSISLLN